MPRIISLCLTAALFLVATPAFAEDVVPDQVTPEAATAPATYKQLMRDALGQQMAGEKTAELATLRKAATLDTKAVQPHERMCTLLYGQGLTGEALEACKGWLTREKAGFKHGQIKALIGSLERKMAKATKPSPAKG
jgi:hypothetical protein